MNRVVVSVGTDHHPFDRLLEWSAVAASELDVDVLVQCGATAPRDDVECVDYLPADDLAAAMERADVVVCHGGPGTIALAQRTGHRPIVVPRDPALGEHVDDHQLRFTAKLTHEGRVDRAGTLDEFIRLVSTPRSPDLRPVGDESADAVRRFGELVDGLVSGSVRPRPWRSRVVLRRVPRDGRPAGR